jgi:hypothetical protein
MLLDPDACRIKYSAHNFDGGLLTIAPPEASLAPQGPFGSFVMISINSISGTSVEGGGSLHPSCLI